VTRARTDYERHLEYDLRTAEVEMSRLHSEISCQREMICELRQMLEATGPSEDSAKITTVCPHGVRSPHLCNSCEELYWANHLAEVAR
jgi:hypothetical protein